MELETSSKELKEIYFIIILNENEINKPFQFDENKNPPKCIFTKKNDKGDIINIFKYIIKKKKNKVELKFSIEDNKAFFASFDAKESYFIFNLDLTSERYLYKSKKTINQNTIQNYEKMNYYKESLLESKEDDKLDILFIDSIKEYSKKPRFEFLINIFINVYKNIDLCSNLLNEFDKNCTKKDQINNIIIENLQKYIEDFNNIYDNLDNLIDDSLNLIDFYGIIFCYLNNINNEKFLEIFRKIYKKNKEIFFNILLKYKYYFKNQINMEFNYLNELINFSASQNYDEFIDNVLFYLKGINIFLKVIEKNKEKIIEINEFHPIEFPTIELEPQTKIKEIEDLINNIIIFSREKKKLLIYFTNDFWDYLLNHCCLLVDNDIEKTKKNIEICFDLREKFIKYYELVQLLYKKKGTIKTECEAYYEKDEYAFNLDKNIMFIIKEDQTIENIEILNFIKHYDIYCQNDKYFNRMDIEIFEKINIEKIDDEFIDEFKKMNFEIIFKDKIEDYLLKLSDKIKKIQDFDSILKLVNEKNLEEKQKINYLNLLKRIYNSLIQEKKLYENEGLEKNIKVLSNLTNFLYINEKNLEFLKQNIGALETKIKNKIYIELIHICNEQQYNKMKEFIEAQFLNSLNLEHLNEFNDFIKNLKNVDYDNLLTQINEKYLIDDSAFFSSEKDLNIDLLILLSKKENLVENNIYFKKSFEILDEIYKKIDKKELKINQFKSFLTNTEENILGRLNLFKLVKHININPKEYYENLQKLNKEIEKVLDDLKYIKNGLEKYYKDINKKEINQINNIIKQINNGNINQYNNFKIEISELLDLKKKAKKVYEYENLKIFNIIYNYVKGNNQDEHFNNAVNFLLKFRENTIKNDKNNDLINVIKEEIKNNNDFDFEKEMDKIMEFNKDNENLKEELSIIYNAKIYEKDLNSIIYFFNNFQKNDKTMNWKKYLSPEYENLSEKGPELLKKILIKLKDNGIYDYSKEINKNKSNYIKFFNCLFDKKEAFDFLLSKTTEDIEILYDKIEPNYGTITVKDITDTSNCVGFFQELKNIKEFDTLLDEIKNKMKDNNLLKRFENFSEIYPSIIELNQNFDFSLNLYDEIKEIITKANFLFYQNEEELIYNINKTSERKTITIDKLRHLKNKIYIKPKEIKKYSEKDNSKQLEYKYEVLTFFKNLVNNIEIIYEYMTILRIKGSSLPISINISIEYPTVKYFLENKEKNFGDIQNFLFNAKNNIIKKIDLFYKQRTNLRFIYGKQFESIIKHLDGNLKIDSILRYILNNTDNKLTIKEGYLSNSRNTNDYFNEYDLYNDNSFQNISKYISTVFQNNDLTIEKHYENILIKELGDHKNNRIKGLYIYESQSYSMEEDILQIFLDKIGKIPLAQNILISNKETSYEEMQAFFNRAILCKFNTLFVVEINNSFSDYQQKVMNNFIDKILTYKNNIYNEKENVNIEKSNTPKYMDSCLIFIYNKNSESFLNDLQKLNPLPLLLGEKEHSLQSCTFTFSNESLKENPKISLYKKTHIIKSEICGLGKSTKIKNEIKKKEKKYIYFPLGGNINKDYIYKKLKELLNNIETNNDYNDVAIHLDLFENKEHSVLNEFLFSFLITKFYSNNENIIYIPKNIEIYIEIPNCFKDFMENYDILKSFDLEIIKLEQIPKLQLSHEKIQTFNNMLGYNTNQKIYDFIHSKIGIPKYSYHQINIFISLFISQYANYSNRKIIFLQGKKDITKKCIELFAKGTKYFTFGGFSKLLINHIDEIKKKNNEDEYIDLLSQIYENDLKEEKFIEPLIFIIKELKVYNLLDISDEGLKECQNSIDYLKKLKVILNLDNPVETKNKENNMKKSLEEIVNKDEYIITKDNFKKMVLILYRIIANIPVILMGETGCGKTALIRKLNQLLNNGEEKLEIININPSYTDVILIEKMKELNEKAKTESKNNKELWIFFDELNTCDSLALITEIFIHRSFNGLKLEENIRLMGACNPYRKKVKNKLKCGLSYLNDDNELIYLVNILPQSLMYYVFNFGSLNSEDEIKYISSIISNLFSEKEEKLKEKTEKTIIKCHEYLRKTFEISIVSLREMTRFTKLCKFFMNYYAKKNNDIIKNETIDKIKSIILSIYICYYIRLEDINIRNNFESELNTSLIELVNYENSGENNKKDEDNLLNKINDPLQSYLKDEIRKNILNNFNHFSDILLIEEKFLLKEIELEKGIGNNKSLRENIFLLFVSLLTNIALIIIGKPGSGKSLSSQLIYKSMRGKYSKSKFFQLFPSIIQSYFQGSNSTIPEDVEKVFQIAEGKLKLLIEKGEKKEELPISMILFDELGLAERSKSNPLKVLHSKLEYDGSKKGVSFIGISNWTLDASKINRALSLSVPDLDDNVDDLRDTSISISKSINENYKDNLIFNNLLPKVYFTYKEILKELKKLTVYKQYELKEYQKIIKENISNSSFVSIFENIQEKDRNEFETFKKIKNRLNDFLISNKIQVSWKQEQFENIEKTEEFEKLYKAEQKIKIDFHGNRDFYYLIKGIAYDLNDNNEIEINTSNKRIIEKYIERNFGGLEIEIDFDMDFEFQNFSYNDFLKKLKGNKNKISSVSFFKEIYNFECAKNDDGMYNDFKFENENIKKYNFINNIITNINDYRSRYLLLEIKSSLAPLIIQNISTKKIEKKIFFIEGSPFPNDNNNEYQFKKLSEIQEHATKEHLIILQNLEQIYPFLYDLFNMNYIIKDGKRYSRICHGNFSDQLVYINPKFRIVIMVDKKFINKVESPFLNRFEKIFISFDKLLDDSQKKLCDKILNGDLNLKEIISYLNKKYKINYELKDLLIGCKKEDIIGLIYCYSNKINNNEDKENEEKEIKTNIFKKIVKLLPQDILINLPEENVLKKTFHREKTFYNLKDYISDFNINKKYKISIIFTFSSIVNVIDCLDESSYFLMISEIKSEIQLINIIDGIINKNKNIKIKKNNFIFIHFDHSNSKKLNFIISFVKNKYSETNFKFILIVHIKRNFKVNKIGNKFEKIYSFPNIDSSINQLFIDNLNGKKIILDDLLNKPIQEILNDDYIDLNKEFKVILRNYLNKNLKTLYGVAQDINLENYIQKLEKYFENDNQFMSDIIEKAKSYLEEKGNNLIEKIYNNQFINKNSIDIISILIEFIRDKIFAQYINKILNLLEDNNFLTTLIVINENPKLINDEIICKIKEKYIKSIKIEKDKKYKPKFILNYILPGFYNFYGELSNFISQNISSEYMRNEKKLRIFLKGDNINTKNNFYEKESFLLTVLFQELKSKEFIFDIINEIPTNLLLNDYITYYLIKYKSNCNMYNNMENISYDDINHRLINLLLKLRFDENIKIIKDNKNEPLKIVLIKINWIESNIYFITQILHLYSILNNIFQNNYNLIKSMEDILKNQNLRYITNQEKNPEITTEVNECYYLILASICYSIIPPIVNFNKIDIDDYFVSLKNALNIIQNLNDDLLIFLNEMYIIDELYHIYDVLVKNEKLKIEELNKISINLKKNDEILQKDDKSELLIQNFVQLYELINQSLNYEDNEYYELLKYIFYKEIKKVPDINYRTIIFENIIKENDIIMNSNDILQILLKGIIIPLKKIFFKTINKILNEKNEIVSLIEMNLNNPNENNYIAISETLLYFFEKNSNIYLNKILSDKKEKILLEDEPLEIFHESIIYLKNYLHNINKLKNKNKNMCKLFCLGYIKSYCYTYIKLIDICSTKLKNSLKIIDEINNNIEDIGNIITIYIYKIIYNKNKRKIDSLLNSEFIQKYKLKEYKNFNKLIINKDENPLIYPYVNSNDELIKKYEEFYNILEKYQNEKYEKVNLKKDFDLNKLGIDIFYFSTNNLILSRLKLKDFDKSPIYNNFYKNVCLPLFKNHYRIFPAIQLFYNPEKFKKIKNDLDIDTEVLNILLYSYRYCLNELNSNNPNSIYSFLYNKKNIDNIKENYYPGNDIRNIRKYEIYSKIINHFNNIPKQGCYVCLCEKGYYHSITGGVPKEKDLNLICKECGQQIGGKEIRMVFKKKIIPVKREEYFRIFRNKEEYEKENKKDKIDYNYMTIEDFKKNYIDNYLKEEKGITKNDEDYLKKDTKIIRNLSYVSYRLLNFILYSHLFFAKLYTENKKFDTYLPKNMNWIKMLNECWELLKIELNKKNISVIDIFMNYIFFDLFTELNKESSIINYESFIKFESKLNKLILKKIDNFKREYKSIDKLIKEDNKDKFSLNNLLNERYQEYEYYDSDYPFYIHFYYSDYINEDYLLEKLNHNERNKYPVLKRYLKHINSSSKKDQYSLDYLNLFNNVLNLFIEKYSYLIIRAKAEETLLENEQFYFDNKDIINEFINFYNNLNKKNQEKNVLSLSKKSKLSDFFIDDNNEIGKSYKEIYNEFIKKQNDEISYLLDNKIENGIFDKDCKNAINIQNANGNEIFLLNFPKNFSFIEIVFNSSYRKVIVNNDYKSYNQFEINFEVIEERMTEILLKNKKLFNNNISNFIYKNEDLVFENIDLITKFKKEYVIEEISISEKVILYQFYSDNKENINLFKSILNDFIQLFIFLNNYPNLLKQNKSIILIEGESKVYETFKVLDDKISNDFKGIFNNNEIFTINKITNLFEYYLILIFRTIKNEFQDYQVKLEDNKKEEIDKYFEKEHIIKKESFKIAIRLFISIFLSNENDKENKIKNNCNNIFIYLTIPDLWDKTIYNKKEFNQELNEIKNLNIQINQILALYELLGDDINENYFEDVKTQIKKNEERKKEKEKEKMDIPSNDENEEEKQKKEEQNEEEEEEEEDDYYKKKDDDDDDEYYGGRD